MDELMTWYQAEKIDIQKQREESAPAFLERKLCADREYYKHLHATLYQKHPEFANFPFNLFHNLEPVYQGHDIEPCSWQGYVRYGFTWDCLEVYLVKYRDDDVKLVVADEEDDEQQYIILGNDPTANLRNFARTLIDMKRIHEENG